MNEIVLLREKLTSQLTSIRSKKDITRSFVVSISVLLEKAQSIERTSVITRITIPQDLIPKEEQAEDILRYIKISQRISLSEDDRPEIKLTIKIPRARKVFIKRVTVYKQFVIATTTEKTDLSLFFRPLLRVLTKVDKFLFDQ